MSSIRNAPPSNTQVTQHSETPKNEGIGRLKNFFVKIGQGLAKAGSTLKNFFLNLGKGLSTRTAQTQQPRALPRDLHVNSEKSAMLVRIRGEMRELLGDDCLKNLATAQSQGKTLEEVIPKSKQDRLKTLMERANGLDDDSFNGLATSTKQGLASIWVLANTKPDGTLEPEALANFRDHVGHLADIQLEGGVEGQNAKNSIMRMNAADTKFLTALQRTVGQPYANNLNREVIQSCNTTTVKEPRTRDLQGEELTDSQNYVINSYEGLLGKVTASVNDVPQEICDACRIIYDKVFAATPSDDRADVAQNSVAGIIVLRLINPTLVAPQERGLPPFKDRNALHLGIAISKLLQNQANSMTEFQAKEMRFATPTIESNVERMNTFLNGIVARGVPLPPPPPPPMPGVGNVGQQQTQGSTGIDEDDSEVTIDLDELIESEDLTDEDEVINDGGLDALNQAGKGFVPTPEKEGDKIEQVTTSNKTTTTTVIEEEIETIEELGTDDDFDGISSDDSFEDPMSDVEDLRDGGLGGTDDVSETRTRKVGTETTTGLVQTTAWTNTTTQHPRGVCEAATSIWLSKISREGTGELTSIRPQDCDELQGLYERGATFTTRLPGMLGVGATFEGVESPTMQIKTGGVNPEVDEVANQLRTLEPGQFSVLVCNGVEGHAMAIYRDVDTLHFFDPNRGMWQASVDDEGMLGIANELAQSSRIFANVTSLTGSMY